MSKKGFTLVELLITISIIAVLSAIGFVTYSYVMKQGQDSKRQSDLRSIQSALEQYYSDQGFYPTTTTTNGLDARLDDSPQSAFTSSVGNPSPPSPAKTYMNALPQDPVDPIQTLRYRYEALPVTPCDNLATGTKCTSYCLYAKLKNPGPVKPAACTNASYNFALTPP